MVLSEHHCIISVVMVIVGMVINVTCDLIVLVITVGEWKVE